jgi:hypothetical protein
MQAKLMSQVHVVTAVLEGYAPDVRLFDCKSMADKVFEELVEEGYKVSQSVETINYDSAL